MWNTVLSGLHQVVAHAYPQIYKRLLTSESAVSSICTVYIFHRCMLCIYDGSVTHNMNGIKYNSYVVWHM